MALAEANYNWRPDLSADDLILGLTEMKFSPIYRSGNIDCCTYVAAVVPTDRLDEWLAVNHDEEIYAAESWYTGMELIFDRGAIVGSHKRPTMFTVITLRDESSNPVNVVVPQTEHNLLEIDYLLTAADHSSIRISRDLNAHKMGCIRIDILRVPRRQAGWSIGDAKSFLTETGIYGREGGFREPVPLAEV